MSSDRCQKEHLLLTALGTVARESHYALGEKICSARLAPIALMQLLPGKQKPHRAVVLCTGEAREKTFPVLQEGIDIPVEPVLIPNGQTKEELWRILQIILEQIPAGTRVTLDLTQGFRSFPFLFFTAALFLRALRQVDIEAVYYGMYEAKVTAPDGREASPVVDLYPVLEMVEWFYATRMFRETGQAHLLSRRLSRFVNPPEGIGHEECKKYGTVKGLQQSIEKLSLQYGQALPVELGLQANDLEKRLGHPLPESLKIEMPVSDELFQAIHSFVEPFIISMDQKPAKNKVILDVKELSRQARVIDTYMEQGYINYALGLIREWMVSAVIWRRGDSSQAWLELNGKKGRSVAERRLGALQKLMQKHRHLLSEGEAWLAGHWDRMSNYRNKLAHHGLRPENSFINQDQVNEIRHLWEEIKNSLKNPEKWDVETGGGGGTLLVSPLGLSKGLLYSALWHTGPDRLLVVTSAQMAPHIEEICARAKWSGDILPPRILEDPHSGFREARDISEDSIGELLRADKIVLNITGGTTALQYAVQEINVKARELDREVEQVALVDRRPPEEQKNDPFVPGELIMLDKDN